MIYFCWTHPIQYKFPVTWLVSISMWWWDSILKTQKSSLRLFSVLCGAFLRVENLHLWWCLADNWLGEEVKENIYTQGWDGGVPMHSCWAEYQNISMIEIFNLLSALFWTRSQTDWFENLTMWNCARRIIDCGWWWSAERIFIKTAALWFWKAYTTLNDIEMKLLRNGTTKFSRTATLVSRNKSDSLGHLYYMHFRSCLIPRVVEDSKGLVMWEDILANAEEDEDWQKLEKEIVESLSSEWGIAGLTGNSLRHPPQIIVLDQTIRPSSMMSDRPWAWPSFSLSLGGEHLSKLCWLSFDTKLTKSLQHNHVKIFTSPCPCRYTIRNALGLEHLGEHYVNTRILFYRFVVQALCLTHFVYLLLEIL